MDSFVFLLSSMLNTWFPARKRTVMATITKILYFMVSPPLWFKPKIRQIVKDGLKDV
jgi:hypothetical protein